MASPPLPEPPQSPGTQFAWTIALSAGFLLVSANWIPKLVDPQVFALEILLLSAILLILNRKKRGPNLAMVLAGILVGFIAALAFSFLVGGNSPVPEWFNRNAGGLQAAAALAGLGILAFQSRFIAWQSRISASQAEMNRTLLELETRRDVARLVVELAVFVSDTLLEVTVINKGMKGSEVESVSVNGKEANGTRFQRIGDLAPAMGGNPEGVQDLFIQEGTRKTFYVAFRDWPRGAQFPLSVEVKVTPVLGDPATYSFTQMGTN